MMPSRKPTVSAFRRALGLFLSLALFISSLPVSGLQAAIQPSLTPSFPVVSYQPPLLRGLIVNPSEPFTFDFILDAGQAGLSPDEIQATSKTLIHYFLASLAFPEKELWVNLSPFEENRIIPTELARTHMGRAMLDQDYLLKQVSSALLHPGNELGEKFWDEIYAGLKEEFGNDVPVEVFNKVWVVPAEVEIYENGDRVMITGSRLAVMLEEDYLAQSRKFSPEDRKNGQALAPEKHEHFKNVFRARIQPRLEELVNFGEQFAPLRQIYNSFILAVWYKNALKDSVLNRGFTGQGRVNGFDHSEEGYRDELYQKYLEAVRSGAFNVIKEEYDAVAQQVVPRQYFSGGLIFAQPEMRPASADRAMLGTGREMMIVSASLDYELADAAMLGAADIDRQISSMLDEMARVRDHRWPITRVAAAFTSDPRRESPFAATATNTIGIHEHGEIMLVLEVLHDHINRFSNGKTPELKAKLNRLAYLVSVEAKIPLNEEATALLKDLLAETGNPFKDGTLYVNSQPCENCSRVLELLDLKALQYLTYPDPQTLSRSNRAMHGLRTQGVALKRLTSESNTSFGVNQFFAEVVARDKAGSDEIRDLIRAEWRRVVEAVALKLGFELQYGHLEQLRTAYLTAVDAFLKKAPTPELFLDAFTDREAFPKFIASAIDIDELVYAIQHDTAPGGEAGNSHIVYRINGQEESPQSYLEPYTLFFLNLLRSESVDSDPRRPDDRKLLSLLNEIEPDELSTKLSQLYDIGRTRYISLHSEWSKSAYPDKRQIVSMVTLRKIGGQWHFLMGRRHDVEDFTDLYAVPSGYVNGMADEVLENASAEQIDRFTAPHERAEPGRESILAAAARQLKKKTGIDAGGAAGIVSRLNDLYRPHTGQLFHFFVNVDTDNTRNVPVTKAEADRQRFADFQWVPVSVLFDPNVRQHPSAEREAVQRWLQANSSDPNAELFLDADLFHNLKNHIISLFYEDFLPAHAFLDMAPAIEPANGLAAIAFDTVPGAEEQYPLGRVEANLSSRTLKVDIAQPSLGIFGFRSQAEFRQFLNMSGIERRRGLPASVDQESLQIYLEADQTAREVVTASAKSNIITINLNTAALLGIQNENARKVLAIMAITHGLQEQRHALAGIALSHRDLVDEDVQLTLELLAHVKMPIRQYLDQLAGVISPESLYLDGLYMEYTLQLADEASRRGEADKRRLPFASVAVNRTTGEMITGIRQPRDMGEAPQFHTHVEIESVRGAQDAGWPAEDTVVYISAESCINCAAGLSSFFKPGRVVFGTIDPYSAMRGRGGEMMRLAGLETEYTILESTRRKARRMLDSFFQSDGTAGNVNTLGYSYDSMAPEIHWYLKDSGRIYSRILQLVKGYPHYYPDLKELTMLVMLYIYIENLLPDSEMDPWPHIVAINADQMNDTSTDLRHNHLTEIASMRSRFPFDDRFKVVLVGSTDNIIRVHDEIMAHKDAELKNDGGIRESNIYVLAGNRLFSYSEYFEFIEQGFDAILYFLDQHRGRYYATMGTAREVNTEIIDQAAEFAGEAIERGISFKNGGGSNSHSNTMRNSINRAAERREALYSQARATAAIPKIISSRIKLPGQAQPGANVDDEVFSRHFLQRMLALITDLYGVSFFEGGAGSFDELLEMWANGINITVRDTYEKFLSRFRTALENVGLENDIDYWPPTFRTAGEAMTNLLDAENERAVVTYDQSDRDQFKGEIQGGMDFIARHPTSFVIAGTPVAGHRLWEGQLIPLFRSISLELVSRDQTVRLASPGLLNVARRPEVLGLAPTVSEDRFYGMFSTLEMDKRNLSRAEIEQAMPQSFFVSNSLLHKALIVNNARAVVLFPGSLEVVGIFKFLLDSIQTGIIPQVPIVLVGDEAYWRHVVEGFKQVVLKEHNPTYNVDLFNWDVLEKLVFSVNTKAEFTALLEDPRFIALHGQGPKRTEAGELIQSHKTESEYVQYFRAFRENTNQKRAQVEHLTAEIARRFDPAKLKAEGAFLDLGAGDGEITQQVAGLFAESTAVEPKEKFVAQMRRNRAVTNVVQGNFETYNPLGKKFDVILLSHSFYYIPEEKRAEDVKRFAKWLKPGGMIVIYHGAESHGKDQKYSVVYDIARKEFDTVKLEAIDAIKAGGLYVHHEVLPSEVVTQDIHDMIHALKFLIPLQIEYLNLLEGVIWDYVSDNLWDEERQRFVLQNPQDVFIITNEAPVGGIDLDSSFLQWDRRGQRLDMPLPEMTGGAEDFRIERLTPQIQQIVPVQNIRLLLGLSEDAAEIPSLSRRN